MRKKNTNPQDRGRLEPTRILKNELPTNARTWNYLLARLQEMNAAKVAGLPPVCEWTVVKAGREVDLYQLDLDFVKARAFDEAAPLLAELFDAIRAGANYTTWGELLRKFYNDFQNLANP